MGQIYIAYRPDDSAAISGRIADRLRALFGERAIMKDVAAAQAGDNAAQGIANAVRQCSALLAVIGPNWLSGVLAAPMDQTYVEIVTALSQGIPVVPILVHGATPPDWRLLPQALWPAFARGSITLGPEETFDRDSAILGETLRRMTPPGGYQPPAHAPGGRAPALPGEAGVQARRASAGRRALLAALVVAVLVVSCGGGGVLLARRISTASAFSFADGAQLSDIASPPGTNDIWAVGGTFHTCILLHYTGGVWSRESCPFAGALNSLSFANSGEGWAVGGDYESCYLLHFHAGSWSPVTCPVAALGAVGKPMVRMDARGGGWIASDKVVLRYDNNTWTVYKGTLGIDGLRTLAVSGQGDAWAISDEGFYEAKNGIWANTKTPLLDEFAYDESMDFSHSDDSGWAVGYIGPLQRAYIAQYQHGQWQPVTPLPSVGALSLVRIGLFGDVWAAGGDNKGQSALPSGLIVRYDGRAWVTMGNPINGPIYGITDVANGDAWAVGDLYTGKYTTRPALLWYHNGYWRIFNR